MSLPQAQNRLRVQTQWVWSYFTGQRGARLIPEAPQLPPNNADSPPYEGYVARHPKAYVAL